MTNVCIQYFIKYIFRRSDSIANLGRIESTLSDKIRIENDCKPLSQQGYYKCRVPLNVEKEFARQINKVTYTLPHTFPDNVKKIEHDKDDKYMIKFTCWGEFDIRLDIEKSTNNSITHELI